jgi:glucan-binding YG repeat protein
MVRRPESTRSPKNRQPTRAQTRSKKKNDDYPALARSNSKEESSNYVEKDGTLIIPEPTPYYYNERIDEFTDEPQSDTGKVKIKEYRNRIASVKVSNLKQLHANP